MTSHALLEAHLKGNRIAHTYLFTGPEGEIKTEMVFWFVRALNCEKGVRAGPCTRPDDKLGQPRGVAPTLCLSCRKIEKKIHPDVQWFEGDKKTGSIKIEEVRSKLHQASLKPYEGKWKVFIMDHAENLTLDAANALLKTLEEPPEHSVFLLLAENKSHVLETIQSRAFEVRTPPEPEKDPRQHAQIHLLEEKGRDAFFESLRSVTKPDLQETLETLLFYLRDRAASEWERSPERSKQCLKAIDSVYEVQEALDSNANQKLALTHLEIHLGQLLR